MCSTARGPLQPSFRASAGPTPSLSLSLLASLPLVHSLFSNSLDWLRLPVVCCVFQLDLDYRRSLAFLTAIKQTPLEEGREDSHRYMDSPPKVSIDVGCYQWRGGDVLAVQTQK